MRSILQLTEEPGAPQPEPPRPGELGSNQPADPSSEPGGGGSSPDSSEGSSDSSTSDVPPEMFLLELGVRLPGLRSLASSVALHALCITLLMTVSIPLRPPEIAKNDPAIPTEIRIGKHLYYVAQLSAKEDREPSKIQLPVAANAGKAGAPAPRMRPAESKEPAPSAAPEPAPAPAPPVPSPANDAATEAQRQAARRALARTFVPPEVKRSPTATQTLIQPMSPPDLIPPSTPLPSFRVMTPQFPRLNRKFVAPGRREERPPAQVPTVAAPEIQMVHADPVATNVQPKLPLPIAPPPPEPVKAPEGPAPAPKGEPLNILSLNDRKVPLTDRVVVPPGNIAQEAGAAETPSNAGSNAGTSDAANGSINKTSATAARAGTGTATSSATAAPGAGASSAGASNGRGTSTAPSLTNTGPGGSGLGNAPTVLPGAGAGASASAGNGAAAGSNGLGSASEGNGRSTVGTGTGAALTGGSNAGSTTVVVGGPGAGGTGANGNDPGRGGAGTGGATVPGQIITRPPNGNFDAVVVQSSPLDQYPESRGLLTGRPIYSVYVKVGTTRDWTLYYCIPNERPTQEKTDVIQLGAAQAAPIKAPYPVKLMRPEVTLPSWAKYVLVHGYVNAQGHFEGIKIVRSVLPDMDRAILASLADWEFRAATRDGSPVMVEFLLSIPARGL